MRNSLSAMACVRCNWSSEAESARSTGPLPFLAQSYRGCLWPVKNNNHFLSVFFFCVCMCVYWQRQGVGGGACSHEQMDFNLKFHTAEKLLQSGTAWRMEARGERGKKKKKNGWKNKEQQRLHEERDVSKAAAEGNIQYLKGWRLRQPSQHKLIWSATIISRAYQGK